MSVQTIESYMTNLDAGSPYEAIKHFVNINIPDFAFKTICSFLPQIVGYVEEDRRFSFKIALGKEKLDSPYGNCASITKIGLPCHESEIKKAIKDIVPFCNTFTNVYIRLASESNELEIGVYTAEQDTFRNQEDFLLNHQYVIFSPVNEAGIIVTKQNMYERDVLYLPLDLGLRTGVPKSLDNQPKYFSQTCRMWDGLFERARREVHGTICLIVDNDYIFQDDCDQVNDTKEEKDTKTFMSGTAVCIKNVIESQSNMELFLAMLNYDGITILKTNGEVVAYHAKCKTDSENTVVGGMRHQALAYLKDAGEKKGHYVGVYFQSQEGKIEFINFKNKRTGASDKGTDFFACEIMMPDSVDSDFCDFFDKTIWHEAVCSLSAEQVDVYNNMTARLLDFFHLSDRELDTLLKILEGKDIKLYSLEEWENYFQDIYYFSETLLEQLKEPLSSKYFDVLRECFELEAKESDAYILVALDCFFLRFNHFQFADMQNHLRNLKKRPDWDNNLNLRLLN